MLGRRRAKPKRPRPTNWREWNTYLFHEWIKPFLIVLAVFLPLRSVVADWNDVPTGSMKPTILEGDRIFVNKLAYGLRVPFTGVWVSRWDSPGRGEIVVCDSPEDGTRLVKRVMGVPGDTITMYRGQLVVNGMPATYGPLDPEDRSGVDPRTREFATETIEGVSHAVMATPGIPEDYTRRSFPTIIVPEGKYLVLGDNRDESKDSRYFGFVDRGSIVGRSGRVVLSVDPDHYYMPRWGRFFKHIP